MCCDFRPPPHGILSAGEVRTCEQDNSQNDYYMGDSDVGPILDNIT